MKYDFDTPVDRRGSCSMKWNVKEDILPMWVADMDFKTAPEIMEAMNKRLEHGVFGYSEIPDEWYSAYSNWWERRHGLPLKREGLIFCTGVVPAISSIVRKLTTPNENVLIQTPVYNIFFNSILNNGCRVLENRLDLKDSAYSINFDDLEKKLADPQTSLMILCNPHNPIGKIWSREELQKIGELAAKYEVIVISDEIHCDLTIPGKDYIPFASVSETCRNISITCIAPTKTFNIAGLHTAAVYVPNWHIRHKVWRGLNTDEVAEPNSFATIAAIAAFEKGECWLDELREYLYENRKTATDFIEKNLPDIKVIPAEATYLVWLDVRKLAGSNRDICDELELKTGLRLSDGASYGKGGENFLRMNIACPASTCLNGLNRLKSFFT